MTEEDRKSVVYGPASDAVCLLEWDIVVDISFCPAAGRSGAAEAGAHAPVRRTAAHTDRNAAERYGIGNSLYGGSIKKAGPFRKARLLP